MTLTYLDYPDNGSFGGAQTLKGRYVNGVLVLPGIPRHLRVRATAAQVNAGLVVLPALPSGQPGGLAAAGYGYRIIDATMIAIGGNASGATSVDLLGTKGGAASRPMVALVAALTQSTRARIGAANVNVLADGASFTTHDVNTALSLTKQSGGSNLAGATAIDLLLTYVVE